MRLPSASSASTAARTAARPWLGGRFRSAPISERRTRLASSVGGERAASEAAAASIFVDALSRQEHSSRHAWTHSISHASRRDSGSTRRVAAARWCAAANLSSPAA